MKDGAKGIGAFLLMILGFVLNIFCVVLPVNAVLYHFCPKFVTNTCITLLFLAKMFVPLVPDLILLILYIIGIPFVWYDFPKLYFVIYIIFMIIHFIITIPPIITGIRAKRFIKRKDKYKQMIRDIIDHPDDDVDMEEFDVVNEEDDYDYYR